MFAEYQRKKILNFNNIAFKYVLAENKNNTTRLKEIDQELTKLNNDHLLTFSREGKIVLGKSLSPAEHCSVMEIKQLDPLLASLFDLSEF